MAQDASLNNGVPGLLPQQIGSKLFLLAGIAAVIAVMVVFWLWSQQPDYRVLFSNFSDKDGGAIVAALDKMNVPYKLSDSGTAILVPAAQVHQARLKLASEGLPKGGNIGFELLENHPEHPFRTFRHLVIAPTKNMDRMEWLVEKATEIGIDRISLIKCSNSERTVVKTDRLIKKAVSAMKQSLKATLPQIDELVSFKEFVKKESAHKKFIAYVDFDNPVELQTLIHPGEANTVLIGPEGDFSPEELQLATDNGYQKVSLGTSRLRTETAGLAAVHLLNLFGK